ncbi:MAG: sigma-54 dependent transcriptional regulator [Deltaproteobacteria bacterium]|nr:sigma-54 dependent transcriptional regulator [Deltaproteobacteria bacterium]
MAAQRTITLSHHLQPDLYQEYVVASGHMREVMELVQKVGQYNASVLIHGESGTGKELLARIIHQVSPRRDKPFVPVNCGTLSGDLFESKLFGHEVGAFTGATRQTKGRFEQAHRGTLFLDEVSEISPRNQVNFLRVLEDGWFRRIGGERPVKTDVRIVAATNKDLAVEVREGNFRKDLYYRLQVIPITLLPLRERRESIPYFVGHFLERFATLHQKERATVEDGVMRALQAYHWPGNVRQLKNFLERLFITANQPAIRLSDLPEDFLAGISGAAEEDPAGGRPAAPAPPPPPPGLEPLWAARERVERALIREALEATGGNRQEAARLLEIKPRTLRQKMSDYQIKYSRKRTGQGEETGA